MTEEQPQLIVSASKKEAIAILDRLCCCNPGMTVAEYLVKYEKVIMILN